MSAKKLLTAAVVAISNFEDTKQKGTWVPWLKVPKEWIKENKGAYRGLYNGLCPHVVIAICNDADNFRKLAQKSIDEAAPKTVIPPPPNSGPLYATYSNGKQDNTGIGRDEAMKVAAADPNALFFLIGGSGGWKKAEDYGLTPAVEAEIPPPPSVAAPVAAPVITPPVTSTPSVVSGFSGGSSLVSMAKQIAEQRRK